MRAFKSFAVALSLSLALLLGWPAVAAEGQTALESKVKAAFLINFAKYVEWPVEAFAETNSPVVLAIELESKVTGEIQKAIAGRTVNGRAIVLKCLAAGEDSGVCHIRFISAAEQHRSPNLLAQLKVGGVLTVGESDEFLELGGIINLARRNQKIALEVNLAAADKARIKVSSKLLGVASVVKGKSK